MQPHYRTPLASPVQVPAHDPAPLARLIYKILIYTLDHPARPADLVYVLLVAQVLVRADNLLLVGHYSVLVRHADVAIVRQDAC